MAKQVNKKQAKAVPLSILLKKGIDPFVIPIPYSIVQPESEMTMFFKGMGDILDKYKGINTDAEFETARTTAKGEMEKLAKPHSPLSPEEAEKASGDYVIKIDALAAGVTTAMIAAEVASLGQVDQCLMSVLQHPYIRAMYNVSTMLHTAPVNEAVMPAYRYKILSDHTPLRAGVIASTSRWAMGLLNDENFAKEMKWQGYTVQEAIKMGIAEIRMPDTMEILQLRRREILTDAGVVDWLKMKRIPEATAKAVSELYYNYPEPYRLASMRAKHKIDDDMYHYGMAVNGLYDEWADAWLAEQEALPDIGTFLSLLRRGVLSPMEFTQYMLWSGFTLPITNQIMMLKDVIPPLTDMIRMAVREAFGKHTYEEQMPALKDWGAKMGLSAEWVERYWYAHWERIPLTQAYENLWRGLWTAAEFERMLRIKDMHPDDRKAIMDVAFRPPSIRELGYGFDTGDYTRADIVRYRRWGGLSEIDANKAADALINYRVSGEREAVRRELMYEFARGKITLTDFESDLRALLTPEESITLWVIRAEKYKDRVSKPTPVEEGRIISSSEAKWAFVHGIRDEEWYREALLSLDWEEDRINLAVERALKEMEPEPVEPVIEEYRTLTLTQIRDLYRFRMVKAEELPQAFMDVGYSETDAARLSSLLIQMEIPVEGARQLTTADVRRLYDMGIFDVGDVYNSYTALGYTSEDAQGLTVYTTVSIAFPDLRAMYSNGWITEETMYNELLALGLESDRASELMMTAVKSEQLTRLKSERDLTKSELVKGVKNELLTPEQGVELLQDLGYSESEAWYILAINQVVSAGDPEGYWDMRKVIEAYKHAIGLTSLTVPDRVLTLEKAIREKKLEIAEMKAQKVGEEQIGIETTALSRLQQEMTRLLKSQKLA